VTDDGGIDERQGVFATDVLLDFEAGRLMIQDAGELMGLRRRQAAQRYKPLGHKIIYDRQ